MQHPWQRFDHLEVRDHRGQSIDVDPGIPMREGHRRSLVAIAVVPFIHATVMAIAGFGFILDDWYTIRNAHFDGAFAAGGADQLLARPGAWLVYGVVFGLLDDAPLLILYLLAAVRAGTAVALWALLRRFVGHEVSLAVAAVWVFLPITSSLEYWASASNIALALLAAVAAAIAADPLEGRNARPWTSAALLGGAALLYEAVVPVAALGVAAVVVLRHGRDARAVVRSLALPFGALAAASAWIMANWNPAKSPSRDLADFSPAIGANFGWGVIGDNALASISATVLLCVIAWSAATMVAPTVVRPAGLAEKLVVLGAVVVALSLVPFAFYLYEPMGVGDRVNVTASVGTAMIWTGAGLLLRRAHESAAVVAAGLLLVAMTAVRLDLIGAYAWAADETDHIIASIPCSVESSPVLAGPKPEVRRNVTSFLYADYHLEPAVQLETGDPRLRVRVVHDRDQLAALGGADLSLTDPRSCGP